MAQFSPTYSLPNDDTNGDGVLDMWDRLWPDSSNSALFADNVTEYDGGPYALPRQSIRITSIIDRSPSMRCSARRSQPGGYDAIAKRSTPFGITDYFTCGDSPRRGETSAKANIDG